MGSADVQFVRAWELSETEKAGRTVGGSDVTDKSSPSSADQPGEPSVNRFLGLTSLKPPLGVNSARADTALKGQYHRL